MAIGERMNEICDQAYMNGYNWEAFLNSYLEENAPEIADAIEMMKRQRHCPSLSDSC